MLQVFARTTSMVPGFAMLLFGGHLKVHHEEGVVRLDDWAVFKVSGKVAVLVRELRSEVGKLLARKMEDVSLDLGSSAVASAMHHLLSTDGF
jgi:ATP-dependent RNA helicase DHX57